MPVHSDGSIPECLLDSDVLIVGAGAVGIAMAVWLSRRGRRVTVLEAGPPSPPVDYHKGNHGPVVGHPHAGIVTGRMKALGGTTRLWGGQLVPFDRGDFDRVDDNGRRFWPIEFEEFDHWVGEAYGLLEVPLSGRETDELWARATGGHPDFGNGLRAHMNTWLPVPDFTELFAPDLSRFGGPDIVTDAEVVGIEFASDGRVETVEVATADGDRQTVRAREFVLANGTLEISRLLLRAAAVSPRCPFADNRHLGRWYLDHLHGAIGTLHDADEGELRQLFDNVYVDGRKYNVKLRLDENERFSGLNAAATLNPRLSPRELVREAAGLVRRAFGRERPIQALRQGLSMLQILGPIGLRYLAQRRVGGLFGQGTMVGIELEPTPTFESRLFLDPDEPSETARIGIEWRLGGGEIAAAALVAERVQASLAGRGLGRMEIESDVLARDPAALLRFSDSAHQMGGARMALSADDGVTDPQGRVFGSANLSVAGAAVFPTGSFANCTLSAIALALRTADRLERATSDAPRLMDRLVFGCARLTGGASERASLSLLAAAFEAGVTAVDVAPSYGMGTAEVVVGKAVSQAARRGQRIEVFAKIGSHRDRRGPIKTWVRAAKRLVRPTLPRNLHGWSPAKAPEFTEKRLPTSEELELSHAISLDRLGRIDRLLLHDIPLSATPDTTQALLQTLAARTGALAGHAISWPAERGSRSAGLLEAAVDPDLLLDSSPGGECADLLHSIVPTMHFCLRTDPVFARNLETAAELLTEGSPQTRRIAVTYALICVRVPDARLIFGSNDLGRLRDFLGAIAEIDRRKLTLEIAAVFA